MPRLLQENLPWLCKPGIDAFIAILCALAILTCWHVGLLHVLPVWMVFGLTALPSLYALSKLMPKLIALLLLGLGCASAVAVIVAVALLASGRDLPTIATMQAQLSRGIDQITEQITEQGKALSSHLPASRQPAVKLTESQLKNWPQRVSGEVIELADGDSFTMRIKDRVVEVRLAEVDAPEYGQAWGQQARKALANKITNASVELDIQTVDRYGRLVATAYVDRTNVGKEMVSEGHAWVYRQYLRDRSLLSAEQRARDNKRGLWAAATQTSPWDYRHARR